MSENIRRRSTVEQYDPKQRVVGALVLFVIIFLIYGFLKIMLGFSVPEDFTIDAPLDIERAAASANTKEGISTSGSSSYAPSIQKRPLPVGFVFLDLDGKPLQKEIYQTPPPVVNNKIFESNGTERWYVQVASFGQKSAAQKLSNEIKSKQVVSEVYIIRSTNSNGYTYYAVKLPPHNNRSEAKQQMKRLVRSVKGIKPRVYPIK